MCSSPWLRVGQAEGRINCDSWRATGKLSLSCPACAPCRVVSRRRHPNPKRLPLKSLPQPLLQQLQLRRRQEQARRARRTSQPSIRCVVCEPLNIVHITCFDRPHTQLLCCTISSFACFGTSISHMPRVLQAWCLVASGCMCSALSLSTAQAK